MSQNTLKALTILFAMIFSSAALSEQLLVNANQLEAVLKEVGALPVDVAKEIPRYGKINKQSTHTAPYSNLITTNIRARMKADTDISGSGASVEVFGLPATIYFPDNPSKDPIKIVQSTNLTLKEYYTERFSNEAISEKFLTASQVKLEFKAMNGEKSKQIIFGQNILKNTETRLEIKNGQLFLVSLIDIKELSEKKAKNYFSEYQFRSSALIKELSDARTDILLALQDDYNNSDEGKAKQKEEDQKEQAAVVEYKTFYKSPHSEIAEGEIDSFLRATNPSDYCECSENLDERSDTSRTYSYYDLSDDENIDATFASHKTYFDVKFTVYYDRELDENQGELDAMLQKMTDHISTKLPEGASSATVKATDYYGIAHATLVYNLDSSPTGKDIENLTKAFDKFLNKNYKKLAKIAKKAAKGL